MADALVLEVQLAITTTSAKPNRNSVTRGWFAVTVIGETTGGQLGRYTFPIGDHDSTRDLWRTLRAQGYEAGWHRAGSIPNPPDGIVDVPDLEQLWRTTATTPRVQLELSR